MPFLTNPDKAAYDFDHGRVNFWASAKGERVPCAVSEEALQDLTNTQTMDPAELVELYRGNAEIIDAIAEEKYNQGLVNEDGYILVTSSDVVR